MEIAMPTNNNDMFAGTANAAKYFNLIPCRLFNMHF